MDEEVMPNYEKSLTRDSAISIAERLADDTAFEVALQKEAEQLRSIGEVEAADCILGEIAFFQRGRELAKIADSGKPLTDAELQIQKSQKTV